MKIDFELDENIDFDKLERNAEKIGKEVLWRSMVKMEELAKKNAPVDTGNLKARIHLTPDVEGFGEYILTDGVDYGRHVEYGTKPHFIPIAPLQGWSGRVLKDSNAAYAVRAKISQSGTRPQPFFRPAFDELKAKWLSLIKRDVIKKYS